MAGSRSRIDEEAARQRAPMPCPNCGTTMTHHADKVVAGGTTGEGDVAIAAALGCSGCGSQQTTLTAAPASELS